MNKGFIKIPRDIVQTEVWHDPDLYRLWSWCLIKARYAEGEVIYNGKSIKLKENQFVTGRFNIEEEYNSGLPTKNRRSGVSLFRQLEKLSRLGFIEQQKTTKYTLISILYGVKTQKGVQQHEQQNGNNMNNNLFTKEESNKKVYKKVRRSKDICTAEIGKIPYTEIIKYLNLKADKDYRVSKRSRELIDARWSEGYRIEDFKTVIDNMVANWTGKEFTSRDGSKTSAETYLRPQTLFGDKFENYLNQERKELTTHEFVSREYAEIKPKD